MKALLFTIIGLSILFTACQTSYDQGNLILMKHQETGQYQCFGCGDGSMGSKICVDPAPVMKTVEQTEDLFCTNDFRIIQNGKEIEINSFEECIAAGNPAMKIYPRQCSDGTNTFIEEIERKEVGEFCVTGSECALPMEYAIMSNCPYTVSCVDSICAVVCPLVYHDPDGESVSYPYVCEENSDCDCDERGSSTISCECVDNACVSVEAKSKEDFPPKVKPCTREYRPVCGQVQIQCITTPCDPIQTTFANACEAKNAKAEILYEGECNEEINPEGACLSFDGAWIEESQECEGMSKTMCEDLGGTFNECASACRNNPDAEICTLQCVQVCDFE